MIYVHVAKIQKNLLFNNHGEEDFCNKSCLIYKRGTLCVLGWSLSPVLMLCTIVFPALHHSVSIGELEY